MRLPSVFLRVHSPLGFASVTIIFSKGLHSLQIHCNYFCNEIAINDARSRKVHVGEGWRGGTEGKNLAWKDLVLKSSNLS